jgi:two-component system response regulator YesN
MNLLIVEDEPLLLNSLAGDIPWEGNGIEVIGLASNGQEALRLIERKRPDLVLLDIRMPQMDGLELVRIVRSRDPDIKCIILSGHDNFAFAQQALELGVSHYLLKPAGETEILRAVLDAAGQLRLELEERHSRSLLQDKWLDNLPRLREMFLQHWLAGKYAPWEVERRCRELLIELPDNGSFVVAMIDMDPLGADERRFAANDMPLLQFSSNSIVREFLASSSLPGRDYSDTTGATVVIFADTAEGEETGGLLLQVHSTAAKLLSVIKECLKLTASVGVSGTGRSREELPELYKQARKSLRERIVYGNDIVIPYREEQGKNVTAAPPVDLEKGLEIGLETGDAAKASTALGDLWSSGVDAAGTVEQVQEHLLHVSCLFVRMIGRQGWSVMQVAGDDYRYFHNLTALATQEQAYGWLQRLAQRYIDYLHAERNSAMNQTIRQIVDIVDRNIDKELSLFAVADRLYVNSSYLSRLFKQQMGRPFSSYVLERKMERAKQLLLDGCRVHHAAHLVGYKDDSYFSRVFRKFWGVAPSEIKP